MSRKLDNNGLPFLPGFSFQDVTKTAFHRPQTLSYSKGLALARPPRLGIGLEPLLTEQMMHEELSGMAGDMPDFTYGSFDTKYIKDLVNLSYHAAPAPTHPDPQPFIPAYVTLDKKVLCFKAYFEEEMINSRDEKRCVRHVVIYYYLEDDSMSISEPWVPNSGILQGQRIKRQCLPKREPGKYYHWKDLNLGIDLEVYGVKYHIAQCDAFTKDFMQRQGIILNAPEEMPVDSYLQGREKPPPTCTTRSEFDSRYQFLHMDRKVLRFFALWDDSESELGETLPVTIHYFLVNDTVEIREDHKPNSGRFPFPVLMQRLRIPKKMKPGHDQFPSCVMEDSVEEVEEFFSPKDFQVGKMMIILGRRFLLYDCDDFTKDYYHANHPEINIKSIEVPRKMGKFEGMKKEIPPYNGFGSLEDSLQSCLSLLPAPPRKNVLKMLENEHKVLRYSARLVTPKDASESQRRKDADRLFILSYYLSNDTICIYENPKNNSGFRGGVFLKRTRVPKPDTSVDNPDFYSPSDFSIGSILDVFGHRFVLTDADLYVLNYMENNPGQIPLETLETIRQKLRSGTNQTAEQNGKTNQTAGQNEPPS
ncbi:EF-hand domain-containing protein 1 isoform X1 [Hippocampus comes]|uniref:EF-hand domain (C-terminal) containing 1 n=1 Tax=Hippocampus comes TaxID=109280 RepID=A0A3Q3DH67_HIPCM|nr:PREDICTED: EF-hand domain-containing protein 1 isoform X1 [Hippocampus comes]